jgi:hypothetical protein
MSNYTRGLTVLDITDPANPIEAGYFDTFPTHNNSTFNGAWGVYPFLPSGTLLISDSDSGLYVVKDETLGSDIATLKFNANEYSVTEGENLQIMVTKSGTGATEVEYEILSGSAIRSDYQGESGILSWSAGEDQSQPITVEVVNDSQAEPEERFFIRLFNPRNGATLQKPALTQVVISSELPNSGTIGFSQQNLSIRENQSEVSITVVRQGGQVGEASVNYELVSDSGEAGTDMQIATGTLNWQNGENQTQSISLVPINDDLTEDTEQLILRLTANDDTQLGNVTQITITLLDDESNLAPQVNAGDDIQVNPQSNCAT